MAQNALVKIRRDVAADWTSADPTLEEGEFGWESDTNKLKIGDGATAWTSLPYFATSGYLLEANMLSEFNLQVEKDTARANIDLGSTATPKFTGFEIGHASDTTLTRASAGDLQVEGNLIYRAGGTDVPITDGGTGSSSAGGARTNLGVGTGDSPEFTAVNIGHATDTTITRASAGVIAVEGVTVATVGSGLIVPTTQSGTSYTAVLGDAPAAQNYMGYIQFTNAAAIAFTIPPNASVAFPIGTTIAIEQDGAGVVTLTPGAGVTLNSRGNLLDTAGQYAVAQVKKVATNVWTVIGDVA
jgi:hypothetical protein